MINENKINILDILIEWINLIEYSPKSDEEGLVYIPYEKFYKTNLIKEEIDEIFILLNKQNLFIYFPDKNSLCDLIINPYGHKTFGQRELDNLLCKFKDINTDFHQVETEVVFPSFISQMDESREIRYTEALRKKEEAEKEIYTLLNKFIVLKPNVEKIKNYRNELKNKNKTELNFRNGFLYFKNKKIKISKTNNSNPYYLLKTIFKDKNKIWNYDEIHKDWLNRDDYKKEDWNKYYNAGYKINEKIAKETTIKDFLCITKKDIKINEKYL